jgi:beta-lactamase class A
LFTGKSSASGMFNRREFFAVSALSLPGFLRAAPTRFSRLPVALAQLEQINGGRLGVAVLDTAGGERAHYRADERFPMTDPHAGGTMTIAALCHAALPRSDNTAANLLLESLGSPAGITGFSRSIGDAVTRLDRMETALNESLAGDPRDTTSPSSGPRASRP